MACHLQLDSDMDPDPAYHFDADMDPNLAYHVGTCVDADPDAMNAEDFWQLAIYNRGFFSDLRFLGSGSLSHS